MSFDVKSVRDQFPALSQNLEGKPPAFFDGPGGTQVPENVIQALTKYLTRANANKGGAFKTSQLTDSTIHRAREAAGDFLGCSGQEVAFGENATTLLYRLAQGLGRRFDGNEEVLITQLDHEANRGPWLSLRERGITVREVQIDPTTLTLDWDDFEAKLSENTALIAFTYASNAVGTVTPASKITDIAQKIGAITVIDGVHYAPHGPLDVQKIGCDFLVCSAYKFFGPHLGILYGKKESFQEIEPYSVRPQSDEIPFKIERGTKNHEGIAGIEATVEFIEQLGENGPSRNRSLDSRRERVLSGMKAIQNYEEPLAKQLAEELADIQGLSVYRPPEKKTATPTVSFTIEGEHSRRVAEKLAQKGLFVWDGDFYATTLIEKLEIAHTGGLVRVGLAPYNTEKETRRLVRAVREIL